MTPQPNTPRRRRGEFPALILLLLISIGFYWKLVLTNQYTWMESNDIARQVLPWFQMQVGELQAGRLPLWDPYVFGGQPLIGQTQPGAAYPLNWLLFAMPTRHGYIRQDFLHWYFVLIHFIGAAACYLLCRDLRLSRRASLIGGCVYGFGGYMTNVEWPQMLHPATWAPVVLLFLMRVAMGRRPWGSAALGGACLGMSFLGGHHQAPIFIGTMAAGILVWTMFRGGRFHLRGLAQLTLFFTLAGMTGALQLLPTYEHSVVSYRWAGAPEPSGHTDVVPYSVHGAYSMGPQTLLGIVLPGIPGHVSPYIGFTAVALALLGWALCWERIEARIAAAVAVGGLAIALGGDALLHGVLYSVLPMFGKARTPAMAIFVFQLGAAVLAGMGVEAAGKAEESPWFGRLERGALWFAAAIAVGVYLLLKQPPFDTRCLITALVAAGLAALIHGWRSGQVTRGAAVAILLALVVVELSNGPASNMPNVVEKERRQNLERISHDDEFLKAIRALPGSPRLEVDDHLIEHNFGDFHGMDIYHAYLASMTRNFYDLIPHEVRTKMLFGIRYQLGKEPVPGYDVEVFAHRDGWKIWENPRAFPRVWTVHRLKRVQSKSEVQWHMTGADFDLRTGSFFYTEPPKVESCPDESQDEAWLLRRAGGMARIFVDMRCRGMVVLGDNDYPGWEATVDGKPAQIHAAYTALRSVVVDKGQHMIEMQYRPRSVYWGAGLTALGLLLAAVMARVEGLLRKE